MQSPGHYLQFYELGRQAYEPVWQAMQDFTQQRSASTPDCFWSVEHDAVFTQGQAGKPEHIINAADIPIVQSDRGGQVTYHGPGQVVLYLLVDIKRKGLSVRDMVSTMELATIDFLASYDITAVLRAGAPGVYVNDAKIASLGLRVRRGCTYHGLSLNLDMDLEPFGRINPCGYQGLDVVDMATLCDSLPSREAAAWQLASNLAGQLGYPGLFTEDVSGLPVL